MDISIVRRQATWLLLSRGIGSLSQALLFVLLARSVDATVFGKANALLGIAIFIGVIADLGLSTYIVKAYALDQNLNKVFVALRLNKISTAAYAVILSSAYLILSLFVGLDPWLALVICWVALDKNIEAQLSVCIAKQDVAAIALSIAIRRFIPLGMFIGCSFLPLDPIINFGLSLVVGSVVGEVHIERWVRRSGELKVQDTHTKGEVLRDALPYSLTNISGQARNLDTAIVSAFSSSIQAASFAAASKVAVPIFLLASAIASSVMPAVANGGHYFSTKLLRALMGGVFASCVLSLAVLPFSNTLMALIFGETYSHAGSLFVLVVIGTIFAAVVSPLAALVQAHGGAGGMAKLGLIFAPLLLISMVAGSLLAGAFGAAWGALIVQAVRAGVMCWIAQRAIHTEKPKKLSDIP